MKTISTFSLVVAVCLCGGLWGGFAKGGNAGSMHNLPVNTLSTADGQPSYTPKEALLRAAADFARLIANAKDAAGQSEMSTVADMFDTLLDENRFCEEGGNAKDGFWATTETRPRPPSWAGVWQFQSSDGTPPGVNLNFDLLPCPTAGKPATMADLVVTASTLMHEAWHAENDKPDEAPDEAAANKFENEFLCCVKETLEGMLPTGVPDLDAAIEDAIDAACEHLVNVVGQRLCGMVPPVAVDLCGCDDSNLLTWDPLATEPSNEVIIPRSNLELCDFRGSSRGFKNVTGRYWLVFSPIDQKLAITRYATSAYNSWTLNIGNLVGNGFAPRVMTLGANKSIVFAGRNNLSGEAMIVRATLSFTAGQPSLSFSTLLSTSLIGDITGLVDITEANNAIVAFDYTNARLVYIDQTTGVVTQVLSSTEQPDLLDMVGLTSSISLDVETGAFRGYGYYLHEKQDSVGLEMSNQVFIEDIGPDGIYDNVVVLKMSE